MCADETSSSIYKDLGGSSSLPSSAAAGSDGLRALLHRRQVPVVTFGQWQAIDAKEVQLGQAVGKIREKLVTTEEQLQAAEVTA